MSTTSEMSSLADQVKQLVAMGISPNEALAAVTAERERQGKTQGQKEKEELSSHSKWSLDKAGSGSTTKPPSPPKTSVSGGRPGLQKPLSYNRPGMLTHVHEESEILPGISPPMRKMRSNDQQDNSMQDIWKDKSTSSPKTSPLDSPAKEKSRGKSRDETSDNRISSRSKASPRTTLETTETVMTLLLMNSWKLIGLIMKKNLRLKGWSGVNSSTNLIPMVFWKPASFNC